MVNVFMLSWNLQQCAKWHFDRHLVKLVLEAAQLASQVHHNVDGAAALRRAASGHIYNDSRGTLFAYCLCSS